MVYKGERPIYYLLALLSIAAAGAGMISQGPLAVLEGFLDLQLHPARLLNDFTAAAGTGSALFNAVLVASIGLVLIRLTRVRLAGPTIAAYFTMMGFGLFGKTPLNILPIIFGVFLSAKLARKTFSEYLLIALFGTALGPLVTFIFAEAGLSGIPAYILGAGTGIVTGMLLPSIAISILQLHKGYNLYNIGFTSGFLALFAAALFSAAGEDLSLGSVWGQNDSSVLTLMIPVMSALFIIMGLILGKKDSLTGFWRIMKLPGRLPSDFFDMESPPAGLVNMGIMGIAVWGYVTAVGGDLNGPVLGGMLTVIGFAAFGKHLKNTAPVIAGVTAACLLFGKDLASPGPVLAALFATTLAPVAGEFGFFAGFTAGFIHLTVVERTAAWHGGINLYNNGFAGGLTATLLIAVIEWYRSNRRVRAETNRRKRR